MHDGTSVRHDYRWPSNEELDAEQVLRLLRQAVLQEKRACRKCETVRMVFSPSVTLALELATMVLNDPKPREARIAKQDMST